MNFSQKRQKIDYYITRNKNHISSKLTLSESFSTDFRFQIWRKEWQIDSHALFIKPSSCLEIGFHLSLPETRL